MKKDMNIRKIIASKVFWRRFAMIVLLALIIIRPIFPGGITRKKNLDLDIWFVVDATGSMVAKDVDGGATRRYEKAAQDLQAIVKRIPGAKYGLIIQDYYSYVTSPLSFDADAILVASEYLKPKSSLNAQPTNLSDLLKYANVEMQKRFDRHPERINAMVFMSDGEDYSGEQLEVPGGLVGLVKNGVVFGYGSENGTIVEKVGDYSGDFSNIKPNVINENEFWEYHEYGGKKYEIDSKSRVISKINQSNLQLIASTVNGKYYHRESGDVPNEVIDYLKKGSSLIDDESAAEINSRKETYWLFALALLILILWEGTEILTKIMEEREANNA